LEAESAGAAAAHAPLAELNDPARASAPTLRIEFVGLLLSADRRDRRDPHAATLMLTVCSNTSRAFSAFSSFRPDEVMIGFRSSQFTGQVMSSCAIFVFPLFLLLRYVVVARITSALGKHMNCPADALMFSVFRFVMLPGRRYLAVRIREALRLVLVEVLVMLAMTSDP
jgi:hypothetical protein